MSDAPKVIQIGLSHEVAAFRESRMSLYINQRYIMRGYAGDVGRIARDIAEALNEAGIETKTVAV